jgi:peptide/nickel transport system ATP-binding protein
VTSTDQRPLLSVRNLGVRFGEKQVLHDVGFDLPAGGSLALVGESGSGKTVTSRVITGLLDRVGGTVTAGTATFDGMDLLTLDAKQWRQLHGRRISLVPQASLSSLHPVIRIGNQVRETVRELDPEADSRARAVELLEMVKLPRPAQLMRSYPHELSGGMRQRVMIALALASRPDLVVADEPTTALDVTVQKGILELLQELRAQTGTALLLIAHDLGVVQQVSERVAVMRAGTILEEGPTEKVLIDPDHSYTKALLAARPDSARKGEALSVLDRDTGSLVTPVVPKAAAPVNAGVVISAQGVGMMFPHSNQHAVKGVDLEVKPGDAIGIVGESGSGKTTLGRMLVGALRPTEGQLLIEGKDWSSINRNDPNRREIQMIFQDPYGSLTPWRTPRQIVAEVVRHWRKCSRTEASQAAEELLLEVGLPAEAIDRRPRRLSGGQCQRVGIARALACDPQVIVADEPTSALDVSVQAQILNLLLALRASRGLALVLISHDLGVVRHMVDEALVMRNGVVVERGDSETLFTNPQEEYTRLLVDSTPSLPVAR